MKQAIYGNTGQTQLLEQGPEARHSVKAAEFRIDSEVDSVLAACGAPLEPVEREIALSQPGVDFCDPVRGTARLTRR